MDDDDAPRLQGGLAENILTALCYNDECAAQLMLTIHPNMFSNDGMRKIAESAMRYISSYGEAPREHIRDFFETELRRPDGSGQLYRYAFDEIAKLGPTLNPKYVMDRLSTFIETAKVREVIEKAKEALDGGDLTGAKLAMSTPAARATFDHGLWLHKPEEMLGFLNDNDDEDTFSSGIQELDARNVRPHRKTLSVLLAPPKAGKSWYLINQAKMNLVYRKRVMHITCENSAELTAKRYVQAIFAMATRKTENIRLPKFTKLEDGTTAFDIETLETEPTVLDATQRAPLTKKLRAMANRPHLLIKEFPSGTLTIPMLIAYIDMIEKTEGFVPDLLIVDYPKMMRLDTKTYRLDLGQIVIQLRGIAVDKNIALSTVMQASKIGKTSRTVTSTMTAEDYSLVGTADTILTYSQTPEEKRIGLARVLVDAARDTGDSYIVMISQSYATGQFCIDSAYMSEYLENEAGRYTGSRKSDDENDNDD